MARFYGFTKKQILDVYRNMILSRSLDMRMLTLLKQGKSFFHMGCSGHEAAQLAASAVFKPGEDWFFPYYRDLAFCIGIGMTARDHMLGSLARAEDPSSGGRQLPHHYGQKKLRIVSQSSSTGTQFLQAVGCALARKLDKTKEIVYVSAGEGTTSQGDFHEALNWSSRAKAPIIFHIQDNEYAISTHKSEQTGGSISALGSGYENLFRYEVDGTNYFETNLAFKQASQRARKGRGPSLVVSNVVRLLPHSSSDDHRKYRSNKDLEQDKKRDPLIIMEEYCIKNKIINKKKSDELLANINNSVDSDAQWAELQEHPDPDSALYHLYSAENNLVETKKNIIEDNVVMVDAINHALKEEMIHNEKMIIFGQDIADPKGGVFTATRGLSTQFGGERVFNSPLAESSIIGTAIGMAVTGYKPVVEIQFADYIWTAMMQIRNEVVTMRYRSNNKWSCPMVIRAPVGGYIHGGLCHSQSIDGFFIHLPGIYIAYPSNASDAKGLLKIACRMSDPVIFMEHKSLYRQSYASSKEPDKNYLLPFGKAKVIKEGDGLSIITWGAMVQKSLDAIKSNEIENGLVEIIDLRTLNPLDFSTIKESIKKTGKALIVHEDNLTNGPGAEISALIAEHCFEILDGPIKRVGAKDVPIPYNSFLEEEILPHVDDIAFSIIDLLEY